MAIERNRKHGEFQISARWWPDSGDPRITSWHAGRDGGDLPYGGPSSESDADFRHTCVSALRRRRKSGGDPKRKSADPEVFSLLTRRSCRCPMAAGWFHPAIVATSLAQRFDANGQRGGGRGNADQHGRRRMLRGYGGKPRLAGTGGWGVGCHRNSFNETGASEQVFDAGLATRRWGESASTRPHPGRHFPD